MSCMDELEQDFLDAALNYLKSRAPESAQSLENQLSRLEGMAEMFHSFPSMVKAGQQANIDLVDVLCQVNSGMSTFSLPMRAILGDAFLAAKIKLFQAFRERLKDEGQHAPQGLIHTADHEAGQSIYTMLLAALLWDLIRNKHVELPTRQRAALQLVNLWEAPDQLEVDDMFPILELVWRARNRVDVVYGSMAGLSEFFQLMRQDCPPFFTSYFTRDDINPDEDAAFQEFLFGLPQEELGKLRSALAEEALQVIDKRSAKDILGHQPSEPNTAEGLYASYRRRQRACQLRRMADMPGPKQTAEGFLILYLLEHPEANRI